MMRKRRKCCKISLEEEKKQRIENSPQVFGSRNEIKSKEQTYTLNITDLPGLLLLHIFSYLDSFELNNCAILCKKFYNIMPYCPQWEKVTLTNPKELKEIKNIKRYNNLKSLTYIASKKSNPIEELPNTFPKLDTLEFYFTARTPCSVFVRELKGFHNLKKISFTGTFVNDDLLKTIGKNCKELKYFTVFNSVPKRRIHRNQIQQDYTPIGRGLSLNPSDKGLLYLLDSCKNLESLQIGGNNKYTLPRITNKSLVNIAEKCPKLKEVSFEHIYNISDDGLKELQNLPQLESLSLLHTRITAKKLIETIEKMPKLKTIHAFSSTIRLSGRDLYRITKMPNLNSVCFSLNDDLITYEEAYKIIMNLKKDFTLLGAFPPSLSNLRHFQFGTTKLLFASGDAGNPSQLSWIQSLRSDIISEKFDDGLH